jgi:hypothetical protein
LPILFSAAFFCSCGNPILGLGGVDPEGGGTGGGNASFDTTDKDVPTGVTPIYIDTQEQFDDFWGLGQNPVYPANGHYILRGNGVANRTFQARYPAPLFALSGTFTGWYKDTAHQATTTIKMRNGQSLFPLVDGAVVSWLKFETETQPSSIPITTVNPAGYVGIIAAEAKNTQFKYVSVSGTVQITSSSPPTAGIYAGGFVGKADANTTFENCNAGASVSVTYAQSGGDGYAGGFAGELFGSVKNSSVSAISSYGYAQSITVSLSVQQGGGAGKMLYAGGVAGLLKGEVTATSVRATVTATGRAETVYAGGYAGSVEGGQIKGNAPDGTLSITAAAEATGGAVAAGGLAGAANNSPLENNTVSGQVSVTARYYDSDAYAGGLAGRLMGTAKITDSSLNATANIQSYASSTTSSTGTAYAGGLAGSIEATCAIEKSSFSAYSGGVSAGFAPANAPPAYSATPVVTGVKAYAGGIAGYAKGPISESYASITLYDFDPTALAQAGIDARVIIANGIACAGGITGQNEGAISQSYAVVTVKARAGTASTDTEGAMAGGISGVSNAAISKTFALALVDARPVAEPNASSKAKAGGIAGLLSGISAKIEESYAAGGVLAHTATANAQAGGIAGYIVSSTPPPTVTKCVALQKYVQSDGDVHRVVGKDNSVALSINYAYDTMRPSSAGSPITIGTPSASDADGAQITANAAKDLNYYVTTSSPLLGWTGTAWQSASSYPILTGLTAPTVPAWAQIP